MSERVDGVEKRLGTPCGCAVEYGKRIADRFLPQVRCLAQQVRVDAVPCEKQVISGRLFKGMTRNFHAQNIDRFPYLMIFKFEKSFPSYSSNNALPKAHHCHAGTSFLPNLWIFVQQSTLCSMQAQASSASVLLGCRSFSRNGLYEVITAR